jgi:hypothetical protein
MKTTTLTLAGLCASLLWLRAAPVVYFGEDLNHSQAPQQPDTPTRLATYPNSASAATKFLARLTGVATETFESFAPGSSPSTLTFGLDTATLSGSRLVLDIPLDPTNTFNGVYPISGNRTLLLQSDVSGFFQIQFSTPQAAFGFYATDIEVAQLQVSLVTAGGARTNLLLPSTLPQWSGGVAFFGVIDEATPFTRVEFTRLGDQGDGFGFDDMTVGRVTQVLPVLQIWPAVELGWYAQSGQVYQVQYTGQLPTTQWFNFGAPVVGVGTNTFMFDSTRYDTKRYYRLINTNQ